MANIFNPALEFIKTLGLTKGLLSFLVLVMHFWVYQLYNKINKDKQKQIDRIAKENREYREHFMKLIKGKGK